MAGVGFALSGRYLCFAADLARDCFCFLYLVIARVFTPRVTAILENERELIARDLAEAEKAKLEAERQGTAYEQSLKTAKTNAESLVKQTQDGRCQKSGSATKRARSFARAKT